MKLKAPPGVGDPCVAGVPIMLLDGFYDVDGSVGALLVECFGFVAVAGEAKQKIATAVPRQSAPLPKLRHPAWRDQPAAKKT